MNDVDIEIVPFRSELAVHFKQLNLAWVSKYFEVEPSDEKMLGNPQQYIIEEGGYIFFAKVADEIAGTFALLKMDPGVYELSKMAVAEAYQGRKIGNAMLGFCLKEAKKIGVKKLMLFSNTKLEPAIHLYKKFGFVQVPLLNSEYKRSNIKMEIDFN